MTETVTWRHLSKDALQRMYRITDAAELKGLIASIHQLDPERRRRDRAITDFHFYNFAFAKSQCFTHEQISAFYSMAAQVMVDDQQQAFCRSADSFARFKRLLLHHAVDRPPSSVRLFDREQTAAIVDYFLGSYYRHFRLYNYILTPATTLVLSQESPGGALAPRAARPLSEAVPQQ